jgi:small subunit ribosomal protein S12e
MSDAGDEINVDAPPEVEVTTEAPKGKMSVEDALQVDLSYNPYLMRC